MKKTASWMLTTVAAGALLAGCTSATADNGSSASGEKVSNACTQAAGTIVDKAREATPLIVPEVPLDLAAAKGKNIWMIMVVTNQFTSAAAEGFNEAAAAAGVKATVYDGQGQTNKFNEGMAQAIAQKADAIVLLGIEPAMLSGSLNDAARAGIPVINALSGDASAPLANGVFANVSADYTADGASLAAWTLVDSNCSASTFFAQPTAIEIYKNMADGAEKVYRENCPDDCSLDIQEIDLANAATDLPQKVETAMKRNPDTTYVMTNWDSGVTFVEPTVAMTNPDAKILGRDGIATSLDSIRSGKGQDVTMAAPPEAWLGWVMVDNAIRSVTGAQPSGIVIPTRLVDETNVGDSNADVNPNYKDFQNAFKEAWSKN
ncbi:substrate-binding domain-containing protein [Gordonia alkanivorans]|uniref:substrate-binding domain-containing protein n=1 Tax=Gordonia alkanivorans TaxID=84096 RepID=UPI00244C5BAC|nr:substrate-binding domain-containing protein [Gordonia alkanivorans]MDH3013761.1 substrate-binding domain-containing protein [Gordonia alkanivorans]MDH3049922.1 substrate-binding domain-containing protein [Gordonia alkanivorans]